MSTCLYCIEVDAQTESTSDPISIAELNRLHLDLKLKEADNRFLQEELDSKDRMLSLLTDGLKEVEVSHSQWINTNQVINAYLIVYYIECCYQCLSNCLLYRMLLSMLISLFIISNVVINAYLIVYYIECCYQCLSNCLLYRILLSMLI